MANALGRIKLCDGRNAFYQWDTGTEIELCQCGEVTEVHFVTPAGLIKRDVVNNICPVPDAALQTAGSLEIFTFSRSADGGITRNEMRVNVIARPKPADYIDPPQESAFIESVYARLKADPDCKGEKGDKGDPGKDGSDADVTAENVEKALGYKPVSDVRVNGASVVADGVADVPIASKAAVGVVKIDNYSIGVAANNNLFLYGARNGDINNRSGNIAIAPNGLDYAVTAAMCDGKGPAWTAAQQAAARERIGIPGEYELIEEITLAEEGAVSRTREPDGTPYNFAVIMLRAEFPAVEKTGNIPILYYIGTLSNEVKSYFLYPYDANSVKYGYSKVWVENSRYRSGWWSCVKGSGEFAQYYENPVQQDKYSVADGNIVDVYISVVAAGTKITIYGVRA